MKSLKTTIFSKTSQRNVCTLLAEGKVSVEFQLLSDLQKIYYTHQLPLHPPIKLKKCNDYNYNVLSILIID